jgi:hypothetical protein
VAAQHRGQQQLLVLQQPNGQSTHQILGDVGGTSTLLGTLQGYTKDGDHLTWSIPGGVDVNSITIQTVQSPSWVGWREIKFFRQ